MPVHRDTSDCLGDVATPAHSTRFPYGHTQAGAYPILQEMSFLIR